MLRRRPYRSVVVSEELSPSSFGPGELLSVLLIVGTLIAIASGFVRLAIKGAEEHRDAAPPAEAARGVDSLEN